MKKNKLEIGYFKEVRLIPTLFSVDIWVCSDSDNLAKYFNKRYGASTEYYKENYCNNAVEDITATESSEVGGEMRIVMHINSWDIPTIIHELNHVIHHLARRTGLGTNYECQEWTSYMLEYLFEQCQNYGTFKTLEYYV